MNFFNRLINPGNIIKNNDQDKLQIKLFNIFFLNISYKKYVAWLFGIKNSVLHILFMYKNCKASWAPKKWYFWTVELEKTLESPLDCKEIQPVHPKEISPEYSLEGWMLKMELQWFGHLMQRTDSLEKTLMLGKIEIESCSVMSDSLRPHGLYSPWNSPGQILEWVAFAFSRVSSQPRSPALQVDSLSAEPQGKPKNSGVGSLSLPLWIFPTQGSNWSLLHCRRILYQLSYQGRSRKDWKQEEKWMTED